MIYTCTLNPSIDYLVELENLEIGTLNRAKHTSFYPGGKGINVSRVLKRLGIRNKAFGFVGGFTGEFIKEYLTKEGISHEFIEHDGPTRINVKVSADRETEINGNGAIIIDQMQQALSDLIGTLSKEDLFVLAGSYPTSISLDYYESLAELCSKKEIPFVIDVSGPSLKDVLKYKPFLIKPNQHELAELVGVDISSKEEAIFHAKKIVENGPVNVIVSMGGDGAVLVNKNLTAVATVPKGQVKNSVGAGDSTVAGFLASYVLHKDLLQAFQYGVAAGTATAFSIDLCQQTDVDRIYPQIKVVQQ
ncbi:1-phosphofructokinase [Bacillus sp. DJP31]|uniref:1-phosphofructokinase n=1 Tax=Bacillus sp. DJP31 TaxID=3409789 RepID=UPI003BB4C7B0